MYLEIAMAAGKARSGYSVEPDLAAVNVGMHRAMSISCAGCRRFPQWAGSVGGGFVGPVG
jgi:hypothetical protein